MGLFIQSVFLHDIGGELQKIYLYHYAYILRVLIQYEFFPCVLRGIRKGFIMLLTILRLLSVMISSVFQESCYNGRLSHIIYIDRVFPLYSFFHNIEGKMKTKIYHIAYIHRVFTQNEFFDNF